MDGPLTSGLSIFADGKEQGVRKVSMMKIGMILNGAVAGDCQTEHKDWKR
jgi:hypothetical protein